MRSRLRVHDDPSAKRAGRRGAGVGAVPGPRVARPEPEWRDVHRELQRHKGVTLRLLWLEYREAHPNGYQYSRFCERYREWRGRLDVVMRQVHRAGEKAFVDYAGPKFEVVDRGTGEVRGALVFVGVLGASNHTFVDVTWRPEPHQPGAGHPLRHHGAARETVAPLLISSEDLPSGGRRWRAGVGRQQQPHPRRMGRQQRTRRCLENRGGRARRIPDGCRAC